MVVSPPKIELPSLGRSKDFDYDSGYNMIHATANAPLKERNERSMADTEKQYIWSESGGFHARLIPDILIGALIGPFFVSLAISALSSDFDKAFEGHDSSLHWPGIMDCILGIPLGGGFGYLFGLGRCHQRLRWIRWAKQHGWKFVAKPGDEIVQSLRHGEQLKNSGIYWHHAQKRNLLTRQFKDRAAAVHTSTGYTHIDFKHGDHSGKKKSPIALFLVLDTKTDCPDMVIHSHSLGDRLELPGQLQPVTFESIEFNKKWTVKARDPKAAYDRLSQQTLEYLLGQRPEFLVEFIGGLLVIQLRLLDYGSHVEMNNYSPMTVYSELFRIAEGFTRAVPDDLLEPISLRDSNTAKNAGRKMGSSKPSSEA